MQPGDTSLEMVDTSLYGFAGKVGRPKGMVSFPLTLRAEPFRITYLLKVLVVDIPSAPNVVLGKPTLNSFQAVISTFHMKINFFVLGGVGEVEGDQLQSHKCYVEAIRKGQKRGLEDIQKEEARKRPGARRSK
ncbi:UNVERIFIED_CONTAM: hypothetical protein Slati_2377400 [Sesamum latifolium]|uniref:Uncharacterized protein n=1 Tax=Sesamum latifolium TaxID=2727402 RepID=A0AAW2WC97_9LAMI